MSTHRLPPSGDEFLKRLAELRLRIDSLPIDQRSHLHDLAATVERQHSALHARKAEQADVD